MVLARKTTVKGLLLNQAFAAGVGNWIADEVLYQAELAPTRRANALKSDEVKALRKALGAVVRKAVSVDADKKRFPKAWLFHHRWGQVEGATTYRGEPLSLIRWPAEPRLGCRRYSPKEGWTQTRGSRSRHNLFESRESGRRGWFVFVAVA